MKKLLLTSLLISSLPVMADTIKHVPYVKIGMGYKFEEMDMTRLVKDPNRAPNEQFYLDKIYDPWSARIQIGIKAGNWTYGVDHHSQWLTGWPMQSCGGSKCKEYYKTEVFIDYTWTFDSLSFSFGD